MVCGIHLYREDMGPRHSSDTRAIDSSWVGTLSSAAQAVLHLWEDAISSKVFDEQIMICKMSGSMVSDMLVRSPIKERLGTIDGDAADVADGKPDNSDESNVIVETTVAIKEHPNNTNILPMMVNSINGFSLHASVLTGAACSVQIQGQLMVSVTS